MWSVQSINQQLYQITVDYIHVQYIFLVLMSNLILFIGIIYCRSYCPLLPAVQWRTRCTRRIPSWGTTVTSTTLSTYSAPWRSSRSRSSPHCSEVWRSEELCRTDPSLSNDRLEQSSKHFVFILGMGIIKSSNFFILISWDSIFHSKVDICTWN